MNVVHRLAAESKVDVIVVDVTLEFVYTPGARGEQPQPPRPLMIITRSTRCETRESAAYVLCRSLGEA